MQTVPFTVQEESEIRLLVKSELDGLEEVRERIGGKPSPYMIVLRSILEKLS